MTDTRVRKKGRRYSPEQRAQVLAVLKASGGKVKPTSRETGVPPQTIRAWRDAPDQYAPAEIRAKAERDLATEVDEVRWLYLERAREVGAIRSTSGFYAVQAFQKLTEAHQLLRGEPTAIIDSPLGQLLTELRDMRKPLEVIEGGLTG